ncbi:MAG TPA: pyruvate dehydrogenase complex dihydrolipoamide acetyltransferase [Xanthobacteraceae bacterium]|jgi:pyruvate dehydrogenase E2 component (dihydrolipoamide acetyltransferase)|nr:pyruvate dehydrogenase complex dihydrolipoamide acetyltransferase [Xanthobacteraceae bacterium]
MPINILMPALSPTMEKGNLAKWLKKEGDKVKTGDILAEIETDKATMEYEAVDDGVLAKIVVPEGTADVPVNQLIAVLAGEGEDVKAAAAGAGKGTTSAGAASPSPQQGEGAPRSGASEGSSAQAASSSPTTTSERPSPPPSPPRGEGAAGAAGAGSAPAPAQKTNGQGRLFSSPLARRLAKEAGIDLARVQGSGPHGRVVARDIAQAKTGGAMKTPAGAPGIALAQAPSDDKIRALFEPGSYEVVPHDNIRKIIAQRLVQAKQTIPHFYLTVACTIDKLLAAREDINSTAPKREDGKPAWKLSVNDFVIKALALALVRVPDANVTWTESGMLKHKRVDIGVAVSIPGGLITPVVRHADTKSLTAISAEMKDLAARARARRLKPEEYQGGSTAVSNLGMYGVEEFAAVINPPHATILAVGAGEERAVVRDGRIVVATQMKLTLSTDHRAVDGALGAELMGAIRQYIESPTAMLV